MATACLDRFIVFGSYITAKAEPNDVDVFLVMSGQFEIDNQTGATREMFIHRHAQRTFNASVFGSTGSLVLLRLIISLKGGRLSAIDPGEESLRWYYDQQR
jgi:uncharacterized protein DUF6932